MQSKFLILSLPLLLSMAATSAWGAGEPSAEEETSPPTQPSNIEGWQEEDQDTTWTWFGMGYESRNPGAGPEGVANANNSGPSAGSGGGSGRGR